MRLILEKKTKKVIGIIEDNITSHLPNSKIGNSTFIDIDFNEKELKKNKIYQELKKTKVLGKKFIKKGSKISFEEIEPRLIDVVHLDIQKPIFHKDIKIYTKKAIKKGAIVKINDGGKNVFITIEAKNKEIGRMHFIRKNCCSYFYQTGQVFDREYYPHYLGMYKFYEYLKDKNIKYINLGGLTKNDEDLNRFKKKWGKVFKERYI
jgi:hypothetical protein